MPRAVSYLLKADDNTYVQTWDALVDKPDDGHTTATARRCSAFTDRPLMPSECLALAKAATEAALAAEQVAVGSRG